MNPTSPEHRSDPSIQTRLMIIVERAVRPVEAGTHRALRMREELLAHVTAVYEEELAALRDGAGDGGRDAAGDVDRALERTRQRFGDPAALAAQLQQSVPRLERWTRRLELSFVARRYTAFQLASRCAALSLLLPGAPLLIVLITQRRLLEWPLIGAVAAFVFCFTLLVHKTLSMLFSPRRPSSIEVAGMGLAAWLLMPTVTCLLGFVLTGDWPAALQDLPALLTFSLMMPLLLLIAAWGFALELRTQRPWTSLALD